MESKRFAYIWQYQIRPSCRLEFLAAYKPSGEWASLFAKDYSYLKTKLLQDIDDENRYVTIDFWRSKADRDTFRERYSDEFDDLDSRCEEYTQHEQFMGDYVEIDDGAA